MRRCVLVLLASIATTLPSVADTPAEQLNVWREVTFTAPIPCSVVCPYWLDTANSDVDGNGSEDIAFSSCGNPRGTADVLAGLPGVPHEQGTTYDDVVVGPVPEGGRLLFFESFPAVDWDTYICSMDGRELASGANLLDPNSCTGLPVPNSPIPTGCSEEATIQAEPGQQYVLRAYNWSDPFPMEGRYCWSTAGSCA